MPEMPEVHTITEDLKKYAANAVIKDVEIKGEYQTLPDNITFLDTTKNQKIVRAFRVAKNIMLELESNQFIQIHLAMTGRILLREKGFKADKWERVVFHVEKNEKEFELRFCDMRMFGKVVLLNADELEMLQQKYGPEPLQENLTPEAFLRHLQSKNSNIKNVLLDQNIIAGMGNVYVTDALWIAEIHPETRTKDFNKEMAAKLLEASREILTEGIGNRGISMSDYVDLFGKKGKQQEFFRIYGKEICTRCNTQVEFKKINGRGTYFCTTCQIKGTTDGRLL